MNLLELAQQAGIKPKRVASTGGGEYHSSCPLCGGTDRFYMQPHKQMAKCVGYYCCRQCGACGDVIQFARQFLNMSFQDAVVTVNATVPDREGPQIFQWFQASAPAALKRPPEQWVVQAIRYVMQAHEQLLHRPDALRFLADRGLPFDAVQCFKFGWSSGDKFFSRTDWGLDEQQDDDGKLRKLWFPRGLLVPFIERSGCVTRLKVRRVDYHKQDTLPKYVAISGSMNGMSIVGDVSKKIMVVVESELDAYAVVHVAGDFVFAVAVGSNIKNPDNLTNLRALRSETLLICHDNDVAGRRMLAKWQKLYMHARPYPTPFGKDIGEAIQQGLDVREWLLRVISP